MLYEVITSFDAVNYLPIWTYIEYDRETDSKSYSVLPVGEVLDNPELISGLTPRDLSKDLEKVWSLVTNRLGNSRITSYNVCYTKLLRWGEAANQFRIIQHLAYRKHTVAFAVGFSVIFNICPYRKVVYSFKGNLPCLIIYCNRNIGSFFVALRNNFV